MTYEEAIESQVTAQEARREIELHGASFDEFTQDCGERESYSGEEVLGWLGY